MNKITPVPILYQVQKRTYGILDYCKVFEIEDDDDYQMADRKVVECKNLMKTIKLHHDPICDATNKAHKAATQARKNLYDAPDQASKILTIKMGNYKQQRDIEQAQEQKLLDEQAKAEHDATCEEAAKKMEEYGEMEAAKAIREMKDEAPITQQITQLTLMTKTKFKPDWKVTKMVKGLIPDEYLKVDEAAILQTIRAKKGATKIPGVEFKEIEAAIRRGE